MARRGLVLLLSLLPLVAPLCCADASNWNVVRQDVVTLDVGALAVAEMSGVTYLGLDPNSNKHRFAAVQDNGGKVVNFDVDLDASGNLLSATAVSELSLANTMDFEGIAFTDDSRNSVFVSEENNPGVREYDFSTGALLQTVSIPSVFTDVDPNSIPNRVPNRGFESLARSTTGDKMWTANEEALTIDGPQSTTSSGSTVRLLELEANGSNFVAGSQFAYNTEPIHTGFFPNRSGLADLILLADGTLLALERSLVAIGSSSYLSSIFEIDFDGASDVSAAIFDAGLLADPNYAPVGKELLWSGAADGASGQNLEGLTLGPQLATGEWILLGVVDDGGEDDILSGNTIISFVATAVPNADFDANGNIDGLDLLAWQQGYGSSVGALLSQGDADRDGDVDRHDLAVWESSYGGALMAAQQVPETSAWLLLLVGATALGLRRSHSSFS